MKTIDEHRANIQEFANKHKVIFDDEGECGFGRECVGLTSGNNWIDFNPFGEEDYIAEFYDARLNKIKPHDAYHKHDCIAVLGRGDEAITQLSEWVDGLKALNITIVDRPSGASNVIELALKGVTIPTIKVNA